MLKGNGLEAPRVTRGSVLKHRLLWLPTRTPDSPTRTVGHIRAEVLPESQENKVEAPEMSRSEGVPPLGVDDLGRKKKGDAAETRAAETGFKQARTGIER